MSKGTQDTFTADTEVIEEETFATAQESVPVALFWGKGLIAARYETPIYGQRAQQAKTQATGKK